MSINKIQSHSLLALLALLICPTIAMGQFGPGNQGGTTGATGTGTETRQYLNNTQVGDALIEVDPETRSLIVITDEETHSHVTEVVDNLDRPKPQVLIKVVFLEVTYRNELDLGVEGGYTRTGGNSTTNVFQTLFGLQPNAQGGIYQLNDRQFNVFFNALAEDGRMEVLSRPSILARNNQEAVITVGQEVPFIRNTRFLQDGQQINTVEYEDIGIILRVTPFITEEENVEMIVAPEISNTTEETVPISAGIEAPVFAKRSAETVVVTPNGETVVIGGLMETNKSETIRKVPLLGDIPLIGAVFRHKVKDNSKTELLIFLTPHIVRHPSALTDVTAKERSKTKMVPESFSDEELERFLDNSGSGGSNDSGGANPSSNPQSENK